MFFHLNQYNQYRTVADSIRVSASRDLAFKYVSNVQRHKKLKVQHRANLHLGHTAMASRARIPIDGLSRCLCPAIDSFLPPRSFHTPGAGRKRTHTQHQTRAVHTNPPENPPNSSTPNPKLNPKPKHPICTVDLDNHTQRGFSSALATAPLGALYKTLHDARNSEGQARRIRLLVRWLVERRRQRPNVMLYEALVVANWATLGSAGEVKGLWEEMRRVGLQATGRFYYAVLRVFFSPEVLVAWGGEWLANWCGIGVSGTSKLFAEE